MTDGSLNFDTRIETSGFKSGIGAITKLGGSAVSAVGKSLAAVSAGLVTLGTAAAAVGANYVDSVSKVSTIADTSVKSITELSAEVKKLSLDTGASASGLNEALYQAISAGADTAKAVDLVGVAVKAAKGGFTDTTTAVDGLTSVLNTYGMATEEADSVANKFLVTQNLGKTSFGELASSIGAVAPTAAATGVSIDEVLASVASLTANGIATSEAITGLKAALSNVIKPSSEATKLADELGIEFSAAGIQAKGFKGFLDEIAAATGGDTEKMAQLFGSVEALNSMLVLTGNGSDLFNESLAEMETNTTALDDAYAAMTDNLATDLEKLKAAAEILGSSVYESISAPLRELVTVGTGYINELAEALEKGGLEGLSTKIGAVLSDALKTVGSYAPQTAQAAADVINGFIDGIDSSSDDMMPVISDVMGVLINAMSQTVPRAAQVAVEIITELVAELLNNAGEITQGAADLIVALADGITAALPELAPAAVDAVIKIADTVISNVCKMGDAAAELIGELSDSLITAENISKLIENVPVLVGKLVFAFLDIAGNLISVGAQFIYNISKGMADIDFSAVFGNIYDRLYDVGAQMHQSLISGYNKTAREELAPEVEQWSKMTKKQLMAENAKLSDELSSKKEYEDLFEVWWTMDLEEAYKSGKITEEVYKEVYNGIRDEAGNVIMDATDFINAKLDGFKEIAQKQSVITDMIANGEYVGDEAMGDTAAETAEAIDEVDEEFLKFYENLKNGKEHGVLTDDQYTAELKAKLNSDKKYACEAYASYWAEIQEVVSDGAETVDEEFLKFYKELEYLRANGDIDDDEYKNRLAAKLNSDKKYACSLYTSYWSEIQETVSEGAEKVDEDFLAWYDDLDYKLSKGDITDDEFKSELAAKLNSDAKYDCAAYKNYWKQIRETVSEGAEGIDKEFLEFYDDLDYQRTRHWITDDEFRSQLEAKLNSDKKYDCALYKSYWAQIEETVSGSADETAKAMKEEWEKIGRLQELGFYTDEEAQKKRLEFIQKYCPEYKDEYYDYYKAVYDYQVSTEEQSLKSTQQTLTEQANIVKDKLSEIASEYQRKYQEIQSQADNYKKHLMSVGKTFEITETEDENGNKTKKYSVKNVAERLRAMREYHASLLKLKKMKASPALISEIMNLGAEDGAYMAKQLINDKNFAEFNSLYKALDDEASAMAQDFYSEDFEKLNNDTAKDITDAYQTLPPELQQIGLDCAEAFKEGFAGGTADMSEFITEKIGEFSEDTAEQIGSMTVDTSFDAVMDDAFGQGEDAGSMFGEGFSDGFNKAVINLIPENMVPFVSKIFSGEIAFGSSGGGQTAPAVSAPAASQDITINITTELDGEVIANNTTKYQTQNARKAGK